jgi:hypothetical protein
MLRPDLVNISPRFDEHLDDFNVSFKLPFLGGDVERRFPCVGARFI